MVLSLEKIATNYRALERQAENKLHNNSHNNIITLDNNNRNNMYTITTTIFTLNKYRLLLCHWSL